MRTSYALSVSSFAIIAIASGAPTPQSPPMCALYFDFRHTNESNLHFGRVTNQGNLEAIVDLGPRFDPQGRITISQDGTSFAFPTLSNQTLNEHFGCCDPHSVMTVNMKTGATTMASPARVHMAKGTNCGLWGCGFLQVGAFDTTSKSVIAWMEPQLPPPPPMAKADSIKGTKDHIGVSLIRFDTESGKASTIRPFFLDASNKTGPAMTGSQTSFSDDHQMWFACNPSADDFNTEGVCSADTTAASTNSAVRSIPWHQKEFTITSIQWSLATKSVIVLAQNIADDTGMTDTRVYEVDIQKHTWTLLAELGKSLGNLHQTTMSADGRHMMVLLNTGNENQPSSSFVTVDVVARKEAGRIQLKKPMVPSGQAFVPLSAMPC